MALLTRWLWVLLLVVAHQAAGPLLAGSNQVLAADWYEGLALPWGPGPLTDQSYGGSVAWWSGQIPLLALLVGVFLRLWNAPRVTFSGPSERRRRRPARAGSPAG